MGVLVAAARRRWAVTERPVHAALPHERDKRCTNRTTPLEYAARDEGMPSSRHQTMVGVAQLVEPWIVIPVVVGSSPIVHPTV